MIRRWSILVLALILVPTVLPAPSPTAPSTPATFFLVRHAEKARGSADPSLTDEGRARAAALARTLADARIDACYSSQFARTRETGEPLARQIGSEVAVVPIESRDIEGFSREFATRLLSNHAGGRALVVGHSNTVPALIRALGVDSAPELGERDYDDLFLVTVNAPGAATLVHLHYGAPSP